MRNHDLDRGWLKIIHQEDQRWQEIRSVSDDIERVASEGAQPEDEQLVKAVFNYILARMLMIDYDLEEA